MKREFRVDKSEFRVAKSEFRVDKSEFRVAKSKFRVVKSEFRVDKSEFRAAKSEFRVAEKRVSSKASFGLTRANLASPYGTLTDICLTRFKIQYRISTCLSKPENLRLIP